MEQTGSKYEGDIASKRLEFTSGLVFELSLDWKVEGDILFHLGIITKEI